MQTLAIAVGTPLTIAFGIFIFASFDRNYRTASAMLVVILIMFLWGIGLTWLLGNGA